ncbi:MAG: 50S ribosomal protein L4 [Mycoplasma sp.]|nr:50S ribosomal protein L4 [Mycoplasma sp.]
MAENKKTSTATEKITKPVEKKTASSTKPVEKKTASSTKPVEKKTASSTKPVEKKTASSTKIVENKIVSKEPKKQIEKTINPTSNLPKEVFGVKVNKQAIFDVILSERASLRQGTHKVKNKGEVAGSGIKPWKQKGTGRARAGYRQSPVWVGGARAFGPTPERNYTLSINKKIRKLALSSALTLKSKENSIFVTNIQLTKISTKKMIDFISSLDMGKTQRKVLIITEDEKVFKSTSNIKNANTIKFNSISIEKIINADIIVFSNEHIKKLVEVVK